MRELGPTFIDITWGAGGARADTTAQFVKAAHEDFGLETCMHLTCTDMSREKVEKALEVRLPGLVVVCRAQGNLAGRMPSNPVATTFWHYVEIRRKVKTSGNPRTTASGMR